MIAIKGLRQGLLIVFDQTENTPWLSQLYELQRKIESSSNFFKGGRIAFDVKGFALSPDEITRAKSMLAEHEVTLWAIISSNAETYTLVEAAGLSPTLSEAPALVKPAAAPPSETEPIAAPEAPANHAAPEAQVAEAEAEAPSSVDAPIAPPTPQAAAIPVVAPVASTPVVATPVSATPSAIDHLDGELLVEGTDGLLVRKRVRSGQVLRHPGHIVVIGDVNPGAALIAGGDIIVWGRLQGSAHAGALGDENAVICALDMTPPSCLLRIADATRVSRPDKRRQPKPETAVLEEQEIVLVAWQPGR